MSELLSPFFYAGYAILFLRADEQERAYDKVISELLREGLHNLRVHVFKSNTGLVQKASPASLSVEPEDEVLAPTIQAALEYTLQPDVTRRSDTIPPERPLPRRDCIYFFFNLRPHLQAAMAQPNNAHFQIIQTIRDAAVILRTVGSHIVFIGSDFTMPPELRDVITFVDFGLPARTEIKSMFGRVVDTYFAGNCPKSIDEDLLERAADSMVGIPMMKAENAISLSLSKQGMIDLDLLQAEKEQVIRQSGAIEWIRDVETAEDLGSYDVLKTKVLERRAFFTQRKRAMDFGIRPPKGILIVGLPGVGKSHAAKVVANMLGLRLYRFNVGGVFKGIVGASEENIRATLRMAEALAPCALWFDEYEKLLAGLESSGKSDSGVTSRVIAELLNWMQECRLPIYKIATCNQIRGLDGALFRRGRWDDLFGADLPQFSERADIFAIHLRKRGRDPELFDLDNLAKASKDFVGGEIESVVDEALNMAFFREKELETADIVEVCGTTKPLAVTDKENIEAFRHWIATRAKNVSSVKVTAAAVSPEKKPGSSRVIRAGVKPVTL